MTEARRDGDFAREPLCAEHRGDLGAQHLERYLARVAQVVGQVDHRHAAMPELPHEAVATGEGGVEVVELVLLCQRRHSL
jgi:hypothetical protein